jgi:hypothetical protein
MNNALTEYLNNNPENRLAEGSSTGSQRPPRVSINNNRFTLIDPSGKMESVNTLHIDVVFVDRNMKMSKLYWGNKYPGEGSPKNPPVCFSDNGIAPSSMSQTPQAPLCVQCPHNVIGSAIGFKGTSIKACGDLKKTAVVVKDHAGVYLLEIKPGSFKNWNNYHSFLRMQKMPSGGTPGLSEVVTRVTFTGQGLLGFEAVAFVEDALAQQVIAVWQHNKQQDITGMMVGNYDLPVHSMLAGPAQPQPQQQIAPPPPKPAEPAEEKKLFSGRDPGAALFPQPPMDQPAETEEPKRRKRAPREAEQTIVTQPGTPPADVVQRLNSLFK